MAFATRDQTYPCVDVRVIEGDGGSGGGDASATTGTVTSVNSAATSTSILAANSSRKGVSINNTDAYTLRIKFGTTASATSFTAIIPSGGYWTMDSPIYTGAIDGIWDGDGSGAAIITELT